MTKDPRCRSLFSAAWLRCWVALATAALVLTLARPAAAQISLATPVNTIGGSAQLGGYSIKGSDIAYDPVHGVYLVIHGFFGPVVGLFVDRFAQPVTPYFTIGGGPSNFPRARYSADLNGGAGGFMVAWAVEGPAGNNEVHTQSIAYPGVVLSSEKIISDPTSPPWLESGTALAYSPVSQRFLVSWGTYPIAANPGTRVAARFIGLDGAPLGAVGRLSSGYGHDPSVAWNSVTNEFGVSFMTENGTGTTSYTVLSVVSGFDVDILSPIRQTFNQAVGYGFITDLDYNPDTNRYVVGWFQQPLSVGPEMRVAELDANTNLVSGGLVSSLLWGLNSLSVSYSPVNRTFLLSSLDNNDSTAGVELNSRGFPVSLRTVLVSGVTTRYNRSSASTAGSEWGIVFSDFYRSLKGFSVGTTLTGGGPPGAWGGSSPSPSPSPTPTPVPGGCTSPAPASDWTCLNGNWLPPGFFTPTATPTPTPSPTPAPSSCSSPAPDVSWSCVNGNWLPPGFPGTTGTTPTPSPTPPPPPPSSCTSPQPATGWTCSNGNWLPPGYLGTPAPSGGCSGTPPASDWVCYGGNWVPPGFPGAPNGCIGPDPFVGLPGIAYGVCVGGNWIPVAGVPLPMPVPTDDLVAISPADWHSGPATAWSLHDPIERRNQVGAAHTKPL